MTADELRQIMPHAGLRADAFVDALNAAMEEFEINTPERQAAFIAQIAHESGELAHVVENLNYSAQGLRGTFSRYFDAQTSGQYARQPEAIANRVYANRMGNGDEASGDGWRYRGAGLIQITGADNQRAVAQHFNVQPAEDVGEWMRTPEGASRSAAFFWHSNGLNDIADRGDFKLITKRINGGYNGLPERIAFHERAQQVLG